MLGESIAELNNEVANNEAQLKEAKSQREKDAAAAAEEIQDFSESTAVRVDGQIRSIIEDNYERAKEIIVTYREQLDRLAEALLEYETLDGEEVDWLLDGSDIGELRKSRKARQREREEEAAANAPKPESNDAGPPVIDGLPGLPEPLPH